MCGLWLENNRMMDEERLNLKFSDFLSNHDDSFEDLREEMWFKEEIGGLRSSEKFKKLLNV